MKNIFRISLTLFLFWTLTSCEDVIDIDLETGETLVAVEGRVTDELGPHYVRLTTTAAYFSNQPSPTVSGATVTITEKDSLGNITFTEQLIESIDKPGLYLTSNWAGKTNYTYVLNFDWNGQNYEAESLLKRIPPMDSIKIHHIENNLFFEDGYYAKWYFQEPDGEELDYYRVKLFANDTILTDNSDIEVYSDRIVNGSYFEGDIINTRAPFELTDTARIEIYSITEDNYQFFVEMIQQINNGGLFANPIANVRTNVTNINPNGTKAVGHFAACGLNTYEIIIAQEEIEEGPIK